MRIFKKGLKIFSIILLSIILFLVIIVGSAKVFESELASYTLSRLESQVDAPMSIGKVSLIPLFSFPRVSAEIHDLWIGDPEDQNMDTLFCITSLKVGLDFWDLIDGIYTIDKVELSGLNFDYTVDKAGHSNIDFLMNAFAGETEAADTVLIQPDEGVIYPIDITAEKIKLENIHINYYDSTTQMASRVYIPEINIKIKAKKDYYKGNTEGSFILSHCVFGETNIHRMESCKVGFELEYDDKKAFIKQLTVVSEGLDLTFEGDLSLNDTIGIDAHIIARGLDFDILKKYIPEQYLLDYGILDMKGTGDVSVKINGLYADSTLIPIIDADVMLRNISLKSKDYPEIRTLNLEANIKGDGNPNMQSTKVNIAQFNIKTPESNVFLKGNIKGLQKPQYDINTILDLSLDEFASFLPDSLAENVKGNVYASLSTSGVLPDKIDENFTEYILDRSSLSLNFHNISLLLVDSIPIDNFSADINYSPQDSGGRLVYINALDFKSEQFQIDIQRSSVSVFFTGEVANPNSIEADLRSFRIQNGNNLVIGNAKFKNASAPEFELNTNLFLDLDELMAYLPDSLINSMTGTIKAAIQTTGKIHPDSIDAQINPLIFENSRFDLGLEDVSISFPDTIMNFDDFSAQISLMNDRLSIRDLSLNYNGLPIQMDSTIVQNLYKTIFLNQKEELFVDTRITLGDINFEDFKHVMALGVESPATDSVPINSSDSILQQSPQNWTFLIHGKVSVKSIIIDSTNFDGFQVNRLHIHDLSTLFKLTDSAYIADQFKFKAFEGEMNNSFHFKKRADGTQSVSSHNVILGMNIKTLLRDMDNFGMDSVITYENISGILSTDLNTFIPIDDSVLLHKTMLSGDIILEEGGVYDYAPAQELSRFSGIKELDNITFKTLRSNIFLFKNKLYVPHTNIVSNVLDIAAFGMQDLEGDCEYHLEAHLSNILFSKSKRRNKKQEAAGDEIDEETLKKRSQKLKYIVEDNKSKAGYASKDLRESMMNKIRVQEKMLNFIFFPKNIHYDTEIDKKD
jgi:hypothetical protein